MALRPGCGQGTGDWLSGRAPRSHRGGHWFDPSIAHKEKAQVTLLPRHLPAGSEQAGTALPYSSQFSGGPGSSRELAVAQTADDGPDREDPGCGANRPGWLTAAPGRHVGAVLGLVCCAAERLPELPERLTGGASVPGGAGKTCSPGPGQARKTVELIRAVMSNARIDLQVFTVTPCCVPYRRPVESP